MTKPAQKTAIFVFGTTVMPRRRRGFFYAKTFPTSSVWRVHLAPDTCSRRGRKGMLWTVDFTLLAILCPSGSNGGPAVKHNWASPRFQVGHPPDQAKRSLL